MRGNELGLPQILDLEYFQEVGDPLGGSAGLGQPHEIGDRPDRGVWGASNLWNSDPP